MALVQDAQKRKPLLIPLRGGWIEGWATLGAYTATRSRSLISFMSRTPCRLLSKHATLTVQLGEMVSTG